MKRIALVTGANKGIGRETARRLAELGYGVWVGARDRARGEKAVEELRAEVKNAQPQQQADIQLVELDVANDVSVAAAAEKIRKEVGRLDVLINNAGIATDCAAPTRQSVPAMRVLFATNVFGVVSLTQALLPLLYESSAARIVNMSSSLGSLALSSDPTTPVAQQAAFFAYAASKTALNAFTIRLANELRDRPIKVNSACPGYVATDLNQHRGVRKVEEGANIVVHLATLPADGPTGGFFNDAGRVAW